MSGTLRFVLGDQPGRDVASLFSAMRPFAAGLEAEHLSGSHGAIRRDSGRFLAHLDPAEGAVDAA
jgi:hypothetical protein